MSRLRQRAAEIVRSYPKEYGGGVSDARAVAEIAAGALLFAAMMFILAWAAPILEAIAGVAP